MTDAMKTAAGIDYPNVIGMTVLPILADVELVSGYRINSDRSLQIRYKSSYTIIPYALEYSGAISVYSLGLELREGENSNCYAFFKGNYGARYFVISYARKS